MHETKELKNCCSDVLTGAVLCNTEGFKKIHSVKSQLKLLI